MANICFRTTWHKIYRIKYKDFVRIPNEKCGQAVEYDQAYNNTWHSSIIRSLVSYTYDITWYLVYDIISSQYVPKGRLVYTWYSSRYLV